MSESTEHDTTEPSGIDRERVDRLAAARELSDAFAHGDRAAVEARLAPGFRFSAPPDPALDRDSFFERCWPGAGTGRTVRFIRLLEHDGEEGPEVIMTYEAESADGSRGVNTEVLTFDGAQVVRQEVYFGWTIPETSPQ